MVRDSLTVVAAVPIADQGGYIHDMPSTQSGSAAIVTGAGSGIGAALARELSRRAHRVVVVDVDGSAAEATVAAIRANGGTADAAVVDVTEPGALDTLIQTVAATHDLAYVFNNAGIGGTLPFAEATPAHWDRIIALNLRSVIEGTTAAFGVMAPQGHGHIVNTASVAGLVPVPMQVLYNTTKFAVVGLTTSLAPEAAAVGVRLSVICPGNVATDIFSKSVLGASAGPVEPPRDAISADAAAWLIMRGIDRKRGVIVFPRAARLLVGLHRIGGKGWHQWAANELRRRTSTLSR